MEASVEVVPAMENVPELTVKPPLALIVVLTGCVSVLPVAGSMYNNPVTVKVVGITTLELEIVNLLND